MTMSFGPRTPRTCDHFSAAALRGGMALMSRGVRPGREWTRTDALRGVSRLTGKTYELHQFDEAYSDLVTWMKTESGRTGK